MANDEFGSDDSDYSDSMSDYDSDDYSNYSAEDSEDFDVSDFIDRQLSHDYSFLPSYHGDHDDFEMRHRHTNFSPEQGPPSLALEQNMLLNLAHKRVDDNFYSGPSPLNWNGIPSTANPYRNLNYQV